MGWPQGLPCCLLLLRHSGHEAIASRTRSLSRAADSTPLRRRPAGFDSPLSRSTTWRLSRRASGVHTATIRASSFLPETLTGRSWNITSSASDAKHPASCREMGSAGRRCGSGSMQSRHRRGSSAACSCPRRSRGWSAIADRDRQGIPVMAPADPAGTISGRRRAAAPNAGLRQARQPQ
jgi:hypothetical protein